MRMPLIFNDSGDPKVAGDVFLFDTAEAVGGYLDASHIIDGDVELFGYDAEGRRLQLEIQPVRHRGLFGREVVVGGHMGEVVPTLAETEPTHAGELRQILTQHLARPLPRQPGRTQEWLESASLDDLVQAARDLYTIRF